MAPLLFAAAILISLSLTAASNLNSYDIIILIFTGIDLFTIIPVTQYVYLNDTVTFECATNLTGYSLYFLVGGKVPSSQASDTLPNGGIAISFNLTASNQLNGTDVTCYTVNGNATETAYVYVQG